MPSQLRTPDIEVQRAAMKKLSFLVGKWSGETRLFRVPGEPVKLAQTEEAQYKLNGLILLIEGIGRDAGGNALLQAFGIVSYDDAAGEYRMRAYNDGRYLETAVTLAGDGLGLNWGFELGEIKTQSTLRINEAGDWTELAQITIGSQPARKSLELNVSRHL